jgi:hypothetical protein
MVISRRRTNPPGQKEATMQVLVLTGARPTVRHDA